MCLTLAYAAGIVLSRPVPVGIWAPLALAGFVLLAFALRERPRAACAALLLAAALGGMLRGGMVLRAPDLPPMGKWKVEGSIRGEVNANEKAVMFVLGDVRVQAEEGAPWQTLSGGLYCYCPTQTPLELMHGQRITVDGTAYLPTGARNPGGFDQRMWLAQKGVHVRMYATGTPAVVEAAAGSLRGWALRVNQAIGSRMDALFGRASPVLRAMVLGDQSGVPDEWAKWMQESSIAHLLAVSGLHVGLWYLLLQRLLRRVPVTETERWVLLCLLLGLYTLITGLKTSVIRASVMLLTVQGARIARRKPDPMTSVSVAALAILLVRPLDIFAAGFQLSFCAVLGMILLRPFFERGLALLPEPVGKAMASSLAAQVGILPVASHAFAQVALLAMLLNLIAIPLAGAIIPMAAAATALDALWQPLGWLPAQAVQAMTALFLLLARWTSELALANAPIGAFAWWTAGAFCVCVFLCSTAVVWRWRTRLAAMAVACAVALGIGFAQGSFWPRYVQLDVGQALSGVLHVGRATYVYDTGDEGGDLTEYLLYTGSLVDGLFLSHPHKDHVGGLSELLDAGIRVGTVFVPANADAFGAEPAYYDRLAQAQAQGAQVVELAAGDRLALNGVDATVIAPQRDVSRGSDPNDRSIVLRLDIGGHALLLMGDADGAAEPRGTDVDVDVLQVAHHGSQNAAREPFLADATPDIALVSAGRNSYGHPHPQTLQRLHNAGAMVYNTQESGALTLYFQPGSIRVEAYIDDDT